MKKLIYQYESTTGIYNDDTEQVEEMPILIDTIIENPTEQDIERAKQNAYNGEYTIEDDGQPETETTDAVLDALLGVTV